MRISIWNEKKHFFGKFHKGTLACLERNHLLIWLKKIFTILLLSVYLFSTTAFGQLLKLPVLFHHYVDHVQEDKDFSFIDFLAKHYEGKINHRHRGIAQQEHKNLPFKSADNHFVQPVVIIPQFVGQNDISWWIPVSKKRNQDQQDYSTNYLNTIWQPPRESAIKS